MVDQTPVLDVKPYIPQYDNPLYVEKYSNREPLEVAGFHLADRESIDERLANQEISNGLRATTHDSALGTDVSRDEEIALRLQAEEFDGHSEFGSYLDSRNYYRTGERNLDIENGRTGSSSGLEATRELSNGLNSDLSLYDETSSEISPPPGNDDNLQTPRNGGGIISRTLELHDENMVYSLRSIESHSQGNGAINFNTRNNPNDQTSRNTRLLDGADGPSTDVDLIHRRAVNPRLDNSPIRMGIREAPDGEEGFTSQNNLTASQTLSNIQGVGAIAVPAVANSQNVRSQQNFVHEDINLSDVRIPDWISRPRVSALTVTFNERALIQLNEILGDKADQQKNAIENVLCQDPRSVYLRQRWANQFYTFLIHELHISCRFDDNRHVVTVFQIRHAGRMCECGEPEWQCLGHSPLA